MASTAVTPVPRRDGVRDPVLLLPAVVAAGLVIRWLGVHENVSGTRIAADLALAWSLVATSPPEGLKAASGAASPHRLTHHCGCGCLLAGLFALEADPVSAGSALLAELGGDQRHAAGRADRRPVIAHALSLPGGQAVFSRRSRECPSLCQKVRGYFGSRAS